MVLFTMPEREFNSPDAPVAFPRRKNNGQGEENLMGLSKMSLSKMKRHLMELQPVLN